MKKLVCAVAAVAAGVAMAEGIASANIVGYQTKEAEFAQGTSAMINTFKKVDGSVIKLSDMALNECQSFGNVKLKLYDKNGAVNVDAEGRQQKFVYVHPSLQQVTDFGWIPGWYYWKVGETQAGGSQFKLGSSSALWANDVEIPYGMGYGLERASYTTSITYSGCVADEDQPLVATYAQGTTRLGNVMPCDWKLKDLTLAECQSFGNVKLKFYDKSGAVATTNVNETVSQLKFVYVHPSLQQVTDLGWIPGWYYWKVGTLQATGSQFKLGSSSILWANEVTVPSGKSFGLERADATTTITIPSPLAD